MHDRLGVYDSGIGGLTIWKELKALSPGTPLVYYGDTKHAPYGPLSKKRLLELSFNAFSFLIDQGVTRICVACHTISTNCQKELQEHFSLPIYFVSSVTEALLAPYSSIGIIGTKATVRSHYYQDLLGERLKIIASCPPFAPMIEGGTIDRRILKKYLSQFAPVEALFLACTHYPLIKKEMSLFLPNTPLIDPAKIFASSIPLFPSPGEDLILFSQEKSTQSENFLSLFLGNLYHGFLKNR